MNIRSIRLTAEKTLVSFIRKITLAMKAGALMAAAGTAVMLLGALIPVFTYCSPLLASLFLLPVTEICGRRNAVLVWAVTAILVLLIGADKEAAFFYLFFGWYPLAKQEIDGIRRKLLRSLVKVLIFSAAAASMYALTCYVLGIEEIVESFSSAAWVNVLFFVAVVICMMLYDAALRRLEPRIRRLIEKTVRH